MTQPLPPDELAEELLRKLARFCAYQERCARDVELKLALWNAPQGIRQTVLEKLKIQGFLDEARFARLFAGGKFRNNRWGRVRIRFELRSRGISEGIITEAMGAIPDDEYSEVLRELVKRKLSELKKGKDLNIREKIINFATGKGFEYDLAADTLKELKI